MIRDWRGSAAIPLAVLAGLSSLVSVPSPQLMAAPLPVAKIQVRVPVQVMKPGKVSLSGGWRNQLAVGMLLDLVGPENKIVGQVRLTQVDRDSAQGDFVGNSSAEGNVAIASPVYAVAPFPIAVTGIEGKTLSLLIPRGDRSLRPGDALLIVRNGVGIGSATFRGYRPVSATLTDLKTGLDIQQGDVLWATGGAERVPAESGTEMLLAKESMNSDSVNSDSVNSEPRTTIAQGPIVKPVVKPVVKSENGPTSPSPTAPPVAPEILVPQTSLLPQAPLDVISIGATPIVPQGIASNDVRRLASAGASLSRSGASGLIKVPTAAVTADGDVQFSIFGTLPNTDTRTLGNSTQSALSAGFLPGLEIGVTIGNQSQGRDLTANVKYQVLKEKTGRPALAIGVAELNKNSGTSGAGATYYGVLSKRFLKDSLNLSGGLLRDGLGGGIRPFGGLEIGVTRGVSALVEYDTRDVNYGLRATAWRERLQVSAQHLEGGWEFQAGVRLPYGTENGRATSGRSAAPSTLPWPNDQLRGSNLSDVGAAQAIQAQLIQMGFENVKVRVLRSNETKPSSSTEDVMAVTGAGARTGARTGASNSIEVFYENRIFAHNELDALARVLAVTAPLAPVTISDVSAIVERAAIPILAISLPLDQYRRFMKGEIDDVTLASTVVVENARGDQNYKNEDGNRQSLIPIVTANTGKRNSSFGHSDIFLRPGLQTRVATEVFGFGTGFDLLPELELPLARGLGLNALGVIPLGGPLKSPKTTYDRLSLSYAFKPSSSLLARAHVGRFPNRRDGLVTELLWRPSAGKFLGRAALGLIDGQVNSNQKITYVGEGRYYFSRLDFSARVAGGRFVEGDKGFLFGVTRRFGNTEIGLELRDTDIGRAGVVTLGIPLGPKRVGRPSTVRLRPPDFLDYNHRSLLTRPNFIDVANLTGNEMGLGGNLAQSFLDRDRLNRSYILRSLGRLRQIESSEIVFTEKLLSPQ